MSKTIKPCYPESLSCSLGSDYATHYQSSSECLKWQLARWWFFQVGLLANWSRGGLRGLLSQVCWSQIKIGGFRGFLCFILKVWAEINRSWCCLCYSPSRLVAPLDRSLKHGRACLACFLYCCWCGTKSARCNHLGDQVNHTLSRLLQSLPQCFVHIHVCLCNSRDLWQRNFHCPRVDADTKPSMLTCKKGSTYERPTNFILSSSWRPIYAAVRQLGHVAMLQILSIPVICSMWPVHVTCACVRHTQHCNWHVTCHMSHVIDSRKRKSSVHVGAYSGVHVKGSLFSVIV